MVVESTTSFNVDSDLNMIACMFVITSGIIALVIYLFVRRWDTSRLNKIDRKTSSDDDDTNMDDNSRRVSNKMTKKYKPDKIRDAQYNHPWLLCTLKGHTGRVLNIDFASSGKSLVSCADDRSLMLWNVNDFQLNQHQCVRGSVEFDHARLLRFAPDSKSIVMSVAVANKIIVYKLARKDVNSKAIKFQSVDSVEFPQKHIHDIVSIGIACNGRYIMSASGDNLIIIYDVHGNILKTLEPKLNTLHRAVVSPCGRFVGASGFCPDVFIWEVQFDRGGNYQGVIRAFELKGHSSGVYAFDFNQDSTRAITASRDGSWKLYDTDIRYQQGEEPKQLACGQWDVLRTAAPDSVFAAITPSGDSFAIGASRHVRMYSTEGMVDTDYQPMLDVHTDSLTSIRFSVCGRLLATSGDRYIRIFNNIAGYNSSIVSLTNALKTVGNSDTAQRRRLQERLDDEKAKMQQLLKNDA